MVINAVNRQSNYDITLQATGSLDSIVSFLRDNNIENFETVKKQYTFSAESIKNKNFTGYQYCTNGN